MNWRVAGLVIAGILLSFTLAIVLLGLSLNYNFATPGGFAVLLHPGKPSAGCCDLTPVLYVIAGDFLVWFGFLSGIWFLWREGWNGRGERGCSTLSVNKGRLAGVLAVATVCALPLSYYALQVKSRFHSGLTDTPAEVTEFFILSTAICAAALCGIAILARFWPSAKP